MEVTDNHRTRDFTATYAQIYRALRSKYGSILVKDKKGILNRSQEHFSELLSRDSRVEPDTIYIIPQTPIRTELDELPLLEEVWKAIFQMKNNKASGTDGIPSEIYKHAGEILIDHPHQLFLKIWNTEEIPQDLKDVMIVTIFKKGTGLTVASYYQLPERLSIKSCSTDYNHYWRASYLNHNTVSYPHVAPQT